MQPIFLIGYMGSGKSTLGKGLANKLGFRFVDLDKSVEEEAGKSIAEIFEKEGEDKFRELEKKRLAKLLEETEIVVSTGGGTPCFFDNMDKMNQKGITIYLKMTIGALCNRLKNAKTDRPLIKSLNGEELYQFIKTNLEYRSGFYERAQFTIKGESLMAEDLLKMIQLK